MEQDILHETNTLVSASTAAEMLACDRSTVTRLVQSGILVPVQYIDHGPHRVMLFASAHVEHVAAIRRGEAGDVLDRLDTKAAGAEPTEDRNAATRADWLAAIQYVAKRHQGTFHVGLVRKYVRDESRGPAVGALVTGLVRSGRIEHTGEYAESGNAAQRNAMRPVKVYRVVGDLA